MNIVYSTSDGYAECTGISLWSLLESNISVEEIVIYILAVDISDTNKQRLHSVAEYFHRKLVIIDAKKDFVEAANKFKLPLMRGAYNTYSRIMLNTWFSDLDRILVIDSDTLVCGNIEKLWKTDMTGYLIGAVPEVAMYGKYNNMENHDLISELPLYYNMGICLVNLKEWRDSKTDEFLEYEIANNSENFQIADQSILNKYLNSRILRIPLKYNYYSTVHGVSLEVINKVFFKKSVFDLQEYSEACSNPVIVHYFGHSYERPWFRFSVAIKKDEYLKTRNQTPWQTNTLQGWRKNNSKVLYVYDLICFLLLKIGLRSFCLKFRYIYGQKIKGSLKNLNR